MVVFYLGEFGKLKSFHHAVDAYSGFQWASSLNCEVGFHNYTFTRVNSIMSIPIQIQSHSSLNYIFSEKK